MKHSIFVFHQENHSKTSASASSSDDAYVQHVSSAASNSTPPLLPAASTQHVSLDPSVTPGTPAEGVSAQWHLAFEVPTALIASTEHAIETGVLLRKHKVEIVQFLTTCLLLLTLTTPLVSKVYEKLILRHPTCLK